MKIPHRKPPYFTLAQSERLRKLIRALWVELGTQKQVADALDTSVRTVHEIIAGEHVTRKVAAKLAEYRGTTVEALLGGGP